MKRKNISLARVLRRGQTDAERKLWSVLRNRALSGIKFRRQCSLDEYILDFYAPELKLCIEADGGQHYTAEGRREDSLRTRVLAEKGIRVLRFSDRDILINCEGVCDVILRTARKAPPYLGPLPSGRGEPTEE